MTYCDIVCGDQGRIDAIVSVQDRAEILASGSIAGAPARC
jgi:hypothetical protein